jgi:hypothetical protein
MVYKEKGRNYEQGNSTNEIYFLKLSRSEKSTFSATGHHVI